MRSGVGPGGEITSARAASGNKSAACFVIEAGNGVDVTADIDSDRRRRRRGMSDTGAVMTGALRPEDLPPEALAH